MQHFEVGATPAPFSRVLKVLWQRGFKICNFYKSSFVEHKNKIKHWATQGLQVYIFFYSVAVNDQSLHLGM
jgi:methionine salvage enolase-phosphatase E1